MREVKVNPLKNHEVRKCFSVKIKEHVDFY